MSQLEALNAKAMAQGYGTAGLPAPVVTLEDFFEGNDDLGSIGCNLNSHPGIPQFYRTLLDIRGLDEVQDVLVEISEIGYPELETWAFSGRIYILTRAAKESVAEWTAELEPDDVGEGYMFGVPAAAPALQTGMRVFAVWWD